MADGTIKSRRPIRPGQSGTYSPSHGSPIRRNERHSSPHLSGSDDDDDADGELMKLENYPDTASSLNTTLNNSSDVADYSSSSGIQISRIQTETNVKYYRNGNIQERNIRKINEKLSIPKKAAESQTNGNLVLVVIVAFLIVVASSFYFVNGIRNNVDTVKRPQLRCSFEQPQRDFPKQDKMLWKSLENGVERVLNDIPTKPSVFLLAYEDIGSAYKITRSIVDRTTECMDSKVNALVLSPDDLAFNEMKTDYGVVITKYQNQLKKSGVMLVHDLNKVPSKVAPAFHVFCDVHNPLVDRSIIFLTLQLTGNIPHSGSYVNALHLVENYLRSNWSDVESFILDALIVRVTDEVFVLNKE